MKRYLIAFIIATIFNVGLDLLIGKLSILTLYWELGIVMGLLWYWAIGSFFKEE